MDNVKDTLDRTIDFVGKRYNEYYGGVLSSYEVAGYASNVLTQAILFGNTNLVTRSGGLRDMVEMVSIDDFKKELLEGAVKYASYIEAYPNANRIGTNDAVAFNLYHNVRVSGALGAYEYMNNEEVMNDATLLYCAMHTTGLEREVDYMTQKLLSTQNMISMIEGNGVLSQTNYKK